MCRLAEGEVGYVLIIVISAIYVFNYVLITALITVYLIAESVMECYGMCRSTAGF